MPTFEFDGPGGMTAKIDFPWAWSLERVKAALATLRHPAPGVELSPEEQEAKKFEENKKRLERDRDREREQNRFDKAEKVPCLTREGVRERWLYSSVHDRLFSPWESIEEFIWELNEDRDEEDEEIEEPSYLWDTTPEDIGLRDADTIFGDSFEELYEGAWDHVSKEAIADLDAALKRFYEATQHIAAFTPNYRRAVILKDFEKYFAVKEGDANNS
jgi:hypothetical protein